MTDEILNSPIKETKLPETVYVGTDKIEGYAKITEPEMQLVTKRREAMRTAVTQANTLAVKNAYELAKATKPETEGKLAVLSIRISPPKEEPPYTELTPVHFLPPDMAASMRGPRYGEKFNIIVVSVAWTAYWLIVSEGEIEGLPSYKETQGNVKTHIGKSVFKFNCPQPLLDKVTTFEKTELHVAATHVTLKAFVEKYKSFDDAFVIQMQEAFYAELNEALISLPNCPKECPETELSVTIGYPQPYQLKGEEVILVRERSEMVQQPNPKVVTIKFEEYTYQMKARWSWSVQRACGEEA